MYVYIQIWCIWNIYKSCEGLSPPTSIDNPSYGATFHPFYLFSEPPTFDNFFLLYRPNVMRDKHTKKLVRESYFFMFKKLQNYIKCIFCKKKITMTAILGVKKSSN